MFKKVNDLWLPNPRRTFMPWWQAAGVAGGGDPETWTANNGVLSAQDDALVASYDFEVGVGALTADGKGSNTLTNTGGVAGDASGKIGGCGLYNNTAQSLIKTSGLTDFTMGAGQYLFAQWIRPNGTGVTDSILSMMNSGGGTDPFALLQLNSNKIGFYYNQQSAPNITSTVSVVAGTWMHVAVGRVGITHRLYINGSPDGVDFTLSDAMLVPSAMGYGTFYVDALGTLQFDGRIDLGHIWKAPTFSTLAEMDTFVLNLCNGTTGSAYIG